MSLVLWERVEWFGFVVRDPLRLSSLMLPFGFAVLRLVSPECEVSLLPAPYVESIFAAEAM